MLAERFDLSSRDRIITRLYGGELLPQTVAPWVVEAASDGDTVAGAIVTTQAAALVEQLALVAGQSHGEVERRLVFIGGLAGEPAYRPYLEAAVGKRLPEWTIEEAAGPPEEGALNIARRLD